MSMDFLGSKYNTSKYQDICKKYMRVNHDTSEIIQEEYDKLISKEDKVLCCIIRGTDYTTMKPKGHPVQPTPEMAIMFCKERMSEYGYNKIFLGTEDKKIYSSFKENFNDSLIINEKQFVDYCGGGINNYHFQRENDGYLRGLEYLTTMIIASKCDGLVAGRCGASVVTTMMANNFKYTYYWDLGTY